MSKEGAKLPGETVFSRKLGDFAHFFTFQLLREIRYFLSSTAPAGEFSPFMKFEE